MILEVSLRSIFITFLLMLAAILSGWSIFLSSQSQTSAIETKPDQPDAFMENVAATIMNKLGQPALKVETPHMVHYTENDKTELTTPHVVIYRQSPQPWHINANHAVASPGISNITFWDNVIIHHLADSDNPVTTMRTSKLTILPDSQIAKTAEAVTVTQPDTTVHAIGMLANWDDGTVKLLSQAREEYVPNS